MDARRLGLLRRLVRAAERCARRKRSRPDAIAFRARRSEHLLDLCDRLLAGSWRPAPGLVFVTTRPKHREVHAARFRDRVVHHLIMQELAPEIDRRLSSASFACREGKGTHAAARRLQELMRRLSRWHPSTPRSPSPSRGEGEEDRGVSAPRPLRERGGCASGGVRGALVRVWALQLDVVNFFHSIDREILWRHLQAPLAAAIKARQPPFDLSAAVRAVLDDEPALTARRAGDPNCFGRVPAHKRLGALGPGRGLPIGNLTSQWFANAYLDPLDHFVQRTLGIGAYVRYMDDLILLDLDPARLEAARTRISAFLAERLRLAVHADKPLRPASAGIDFCGYVIRPGYLLPRRRTVGAFRDRLRRAVVPLAPRVIPAGQSLRLPGWGELAGPAALWPLDGRALAHLREVWASSGHLRHGSSARLLARAWRTLPALGRGLVRRPGGRLALRGGDPAAESGCRFWNCFASQRRWLRAQAGEAVLLVQIGRTVEIVARRDARRLGLAWRLGSSLRGPGVGRGQAGLRVALALKAGWPVALAEQTRYGAGAVRGRTLRWWVEPLARTAEWWERACGEPLETARGGSAPWPAPGPWLRRDGPSRPSVDLPRRGAVAASLSLGSPPPRATPPCVGGQYVFAFMIDPEEEP